MVKSHEQKMSKLLCSELPPNFEKTDSASYTSKNGGFWLLWGIFKYIKQNIITVVLRKANAHSVVIRRMIKNQ